MSFRFLEKFVGGGVLLSFAYQIPDFASIVAFMAGAGLLLSGMASLIKQVREVYSDMKVKKVSGRGEGND